MPAEFLLEVLSDVPVRPCAPPAGWSTTEPRSTARTLFTPGQFLCGIVSSSLAGWFKATSEDPSQPRTPPLPEKTEGRDQVVAKLRFPPFSKVFEHWPFGFEVKFSKQARQPHQVGSKLSPAHRRSLYFAAAIISLTEPPHF